MNRTPGVRVAIVANGPRYSAGALGLGSNRSRWLGPPPSQTSRIDLAFGASAASNVFWGNSPPKRMWSGETGTQQKRPATYPPDRFRKESSQRRSSPTGSFAADSRTLAPDIPLS